jgi:Flp pilus assembly protein TadD
MKRKWTADNGGNYWGVKFLCLLLFSIFLGGCSSHDGQFSYFNMLDAGKRTEQNKKAAQKFWSTVRPVSTLSASHYKLGRYYQQQGKYAQAIEAFTKAIRNDSRYCKAYNGIAMCYDALRRYNLAHESYDHALQCDPQGAYIYNNYGLSSLLCGNYEKGLTLLLEAAQLSEDNNRIQNNVLLAQGLIDRNKKTGQFALQWEGIPFRAQTHVEQEVREDEQALMNQVCEIPGASRFWEKQNAGVVERVPFETVGGLPAVSREAGPERDSSFEINIRKVRLIAEKTIKRVTQGQTASIPKRPNADVEVSNGNGVTGMAKKCAAYFSGHDFSVRRITNAKHFSYAESMIFYREGYLQVAKKLSMVIPGFQEMKKVESFDRASVDVRVLLGKDLVKMQFPDGYARKDMEYTEPENENLVSSIEFSRLR